MIAAGEEFSSELRIELSDFTPGLHLLQLRRVSGDWQSLKVLLNRDQ
jgi:hypothetical protein